MTGYGCLNCGDCPAALIPIREEAPKRKALYLCNSCYDEYRLGYIALYICDSCNREYTSDHDEGPNTCSLCSYVSDPNNIQPEDYERHGYLESTTTSNTASCLRKLLTLYVGERKGEDKHTVRDRAMTFFKISKGLPDNQLVIGQMAILARQLDMKPMDYFHVMANYDRTEEGLTELVAIIKEEGFLAYDAAQQDNVEEYIHERPCSTFYQAYLKKYPPSLCLEIDDKFADVPF